jgi:uncharacterized coiled-coil DUF342 family protein
MSTLMVEKKRGMEERDAIIAAKEAAQSAITDQAALEKALRAELTYSSEAEIDRKIKELEKQQATTSVSLRDEKVLLGEIKKLQVMKKSVHQMASIKDAIDKAKARRSVVDKEYADKMSALKSLGERIDRQRAQTDKLLKSCNTADGGDSYPKLRARMTTIRDEMNAKYQRTKELRKDFKDREDEYYAGIKEQRAKEREDREKGMEARRALEEAKKKEREDEELLLPPYSEEIALCDFLSSYLRGIQRASGDADADEARALVGGATLDTTKKLGGMTVIKNELEDYSINTIKKRGKKKGSTKSSTDKIKHTVESIDFFSTLSVTPPATNADIATALERLAEKKTHFQGLERGAVKSISDKRKDKERVSSASNTNTQTSSATTAGSATSGAGMQRTERKEKKGGKPSVFSLEADFPSLMIGASAPADIESNQEEQEQEVQ